MNSQTDFRPTWKVKRSRLPTSSVVFMADSPTTWPLKEAGPGRLILSGHNQPIWEMRSSGQRSEVNIKPSILCVTHRVRDVCSEYSTNMETETGNRSDCSLSLKTHRDTTQYLSNKTHLDRCVCVCVCRTWTVAAETESLWCLNWTQRAERWLTPEPEIQKEMEDQAETQQEYCSTDSNTDNSTSSTAAAAVLDCQERSDLLIAFEGVPQLTQKNTILNRTLHHCMYVTLKHKQTQDWL